MTYATTDARRDEQTNRYMERLNADWAEDGYKTVQPILTSPAAVKAVKDALVSVARESLCPEYASIVEDQLEAHLAPELSILIDAVIG